MERPNHERYYSRKLLTGMREKLQTIGPKTDKLLLKFAGHRFVEEKANEYANHGFLRRIQTFRRCIENVFRIVPPGAVKVPPREKLHDDQHPSGRRQHIWMRGQSGLGVGVRAPSLKEDQALQGRLS
jgi:hypothetical protein